MEKLLISNKSCQQEAIADTDKCASTLWRYNDHPVNALSLDGAHETFSEGVHPRHRLHLIVTMRDELFE